MDSNRDETPLLLLLEELTKTTLDSEEVHEEEVEEEERIISRGLPLPKSNSRQLINEQLIKKKKRDTMVHNVELLKNLIQEKKEDESLKQLAQMINMVTSDQQKKLFFTELRNTERINDSDKETSNGQCTPNSMDSDIYISRSTASAKDCECSLSSLGSSSHNQYLIHKGIEYCRVLLTKFFHAKDNTIIRELKSRNLFNYVLNESTDKDKSYIMNLVDKYPNSFNEILFILKEDESAILQGSIFVQFALKNMSYLYDFLISLIKHGLNKNNLSKSCDESSFNGMRVSDVIKRNKGLEDRRINAKIESFLNKHKNVA